MAEGPTSLTKPLGEAEEKSIVKQIEDMDYHRGFSMRIDIYGEAINTQCWKYSSTTRLKAKRRKSGVPTGVIHIY